MLEPGDPAPPFSLLDQAGETVSLSDFAGRKLLVYFYPEADTPGCTTQSCAVRDARDDLSSLGVDVVGISPDVPEDQRKFDEKFGLGFPLLADTDHAIADAYGVWGEKMNYGKTYMGIIRSSFLIDEAVASSRPGTRSRPRTPCRTPRRRWPARPADDAARPARDRDGGDRRRVRGRVQRRRAPDDLVRRASLGRARQPRALGTRSQPVLR